MGTKHPLRLAALHPQAYSATSVKLLLQNQVLPLPGCDPVPTSGATKCTTQCCCHNAHKALHSTPDHKVQHPPAPDAAAAVLLPEWNPVRSRKVRYPVLLPQPAANS